MPRYRDAVNDGFQFAVVAAEDGGLSMSWRSACGSIRFGEPRSEPAIDGARARGPQ